MKPHDVAIETATLSNFNIGYRIAPKLLSGVLDEMGGEGVADYLCKTLTQKQIERLCEKQKYHIEDRSFEDEPESRWQVWEGYSYRNNEHRKMHYEREEAFNELIVRYTTDFSLGMILEDLTSLLATEGK